MRRYTRRRKAITFKTMIYSGLLVLCVGGLGYFTFQSYGQHRADAFGCFDEIDQAQTFVLFDASEPRFNEEQARSLEIYFQRLYEGLKFNERLSFITSEADQIASMAAPRFHVCGQTTSPSDLEAVGAASGEAGYLKKQKERIYQKIVAPELKALLAENPDESRRQRHQSPIMEMIGDVSRLKSLSPGSRIILVSDLIQNSDSVQFCRVQNDMPPFRHFKESPVYARLKPASLKDVDVEVLMIQRTGYGHAIYEYCASEDELMTFWRTYLEDNGAHAHFVRIRHGLVER